jgi:predicted anti-sigma-YlaC factor YlaD
MRCEDARLALSARLDDEADPRVGDVDDHVAECAMCEAWLAGAERVTRAVRLRPVRVPDLTERIMAALHADGALPGRVRRIRDRVGALRWLLGGLAVVQLVLAVPELFGVNGTHEAHAGREVAAFDIALAVGLLVVASYPEHARVFAPVVVALVVCFATISALDIMQGLVTPSRVAIHALAVVQAVAVWLLAQAPAAPATPARAGLAAHR